MCHGLNSQFVIMDFLLALKINKTLLFSIFFFIPEEISVLFFFLSKQGHTVIGKFLTGIHTVAQQL